MTHDEESVLISALPPATDYLTYLTIIEYNLNKSDLSTLHHLLQDDKLVTNIGWDLVHLLLPLLPESRQCLEDVASLGNPREVILKVTEELDGLGARTSEGDDDEEGEPSIEGEPLRACDDEEAEDDATTTRPPSPDPKKADAFETLLQMLCMLHPRIKTQKPSRFLQTSVSAIISAYYTVAASAEATRAVLMFLQRMSPSSRPSLPPRSGEPAIPTVAAHSAAPDPEGNEDGKADGEDAESLRILRVLVSHIAELHLDSLDSSSFSSPLGWTERYVEKEHPEQFLSEQKMATEALAGSEELRCRETMVNQILSIATIELTIDRKRLISSLTNLPDSTETSEASESIEYSKRGILYLFAAYTFRHATSVNTNDITLPEHDAIATSILGDPQIGFRTDLPPATIDAILLTGWSVIWKPSPDASPLSMNKERFSSYMQKLSALAATQAVPGLRYHAYLLATHVLHSFPYSSTRLDFIRDTLCSCPYANLREVAVGWVKDEYVRLANGEGTEAEADDVFARSDTLSKLATDIFVSESSEITKEALLAEEQVFQASCGLLYFLCVNRALREKLEVRKVMKEMDVERSFVRRLEEAMHREDESGENGLGLGVLKLSVSMAREGLKMLEST